MSIRRITLLYEKFKRAVCTIHRPSDGTPSNCVVIEVYRHRVGEVIDDAGICTERQQRQCRQGAGRSASLLASDQALGGVAELGCFIWFSLKGRLNDRGWLRQSQLIKNLRRNTVSDRRKNALDTIELDIGIVPPPRFQQQ
ncbi:MAG: hypothetical protein WCI11_19490 [Candidatus Methylumidiphilus sp.]